MTQRKMFVKMVTNSILRRRSRVAVALLAVAIGGAIFLGMAAIMYDIPRQMGREFRSYGANMLLVPSGDAKISLGKLSEAASMIPRDALVGLTPYRYGAARINMQSYTAVGSVFDELRKTSPFWRVRGEWPDAPDEIMIGSDIAEFTRLEPGGITTLTGRGEDGARFSREVKISGIARTGGVEDGFIFMGIEPFGEMMGGEGTADTAEVSVAADGAKLDEIASNIAKKIPEISPRLVRRVTQSETAVLSKLQSLVFLVSSVVLALTMICVATTMMTVAMERRREIGLKKAIGADRRSIEAEFLAEGMLLGCAGGALGSALGYAFAQAVSLNVFGRGVAASWWLWPATVFVSAAVTVAACLVPAKSAAAVEPAIVLRGE